MILSHAMASILAAIQGLYLDTKQKINHLLNITDQIKKDRIPSEIRHFPVNSNGSISNTDASIVFDLTNELY